MSKEHPMDDLRLKIIEVTGLKNVYIDPPATIKLEYPCGIITKNSGFTNFANNMPYSHDRSYDFQLIDYDPDSIYYKPIVMGLPKIRVMRHFIADGLHHDNFLIYF